MSRRQSAGPQLTVIWWHDIPGQVVARDGENRHTRALPLRFERAIHRAAVGRGQAGTAAFVSGWRRVSTPCSADLEAEVTAAAEDIEARFDDATLEALIAATRTAQKSHRPSEG
ncbi:MAG: virulence factor, partial [Ornithinimicrobium sp.]